MREAKSLTAISERDEGPRRARARQEAEARRNIRAARARSPTSACTACASSPRSSIRRTRPFSRSARRSGAPVEGEDGAIKFESQMTVTLSCDHRVVDGALGARTARGVQAVHRKSGDSADLASAALRQPEQRRQHVGVVEVVEQLHHRHRDEEDRRIEERHGDLREDLERFAAMIEREFRQEGAVRASCTPVPRAKHVDHVVFFDLRHPQELWSGKPPTSAAVKPPAGADADGADDREQIKRMTRDGIRTVLDQLVIFSVADVERYQLRPSTQIEISAMPASIDS